MVHFVWAYELRDAPHVDAADRSVLAENLKWFEKNLETPSRVNRTKSKGFYRRKTRGIAWFKDAATEHLARMHQIKTVLEQYGHPVVMLSEPRSDRDLRGRVSGRRRACGHHSRRVLRGL
jgi:hypothetical protein